jgi:hypothetical protein
VSHFFFHLITLHKGESNEILKSQSIETSQVPTIVTVYGLSHSTSTVTLEPKSTTFSHFFTSDSIISTFSIKSAISHILEFIKSLSSIADLYSKFSERSHIAFASHNLSRTNGNLFFLRSSNS